MQAITSSSRGRDFFCVSSRSLVSWITVYACSHFQITSLNGQDLETWHHVPGPTLSSLATNSHPWAPMLGSRDSGLQTTNYLNRSSLESAGSTTAVQHPTTTTAGSTELSSFLDRLAHPKYPPKICAASGKLFGKKGILPLQSAKRAQARLEAATSTKSNAFGNRSSVEKRNKRSQAIQPRSRLTGCSTAPRDNSSFRRTAWGDEEGSSAEACARRTVGLR